MKNSVKRSLKEWRLFLFQNSKLTSFTFPTFDFFFQNFLRVGTDFRLALLADEHVLEKTILCFGYLRGHYNFRNKWFLKLFTASFS